MRKNFTEPVCVQEIPVDGIASVDRIGERIKLTYYSTKMVPDGTGGFAREMEIVCRIVMTVAVAESATDHWTGELARLEVGQADLQRPDCAERAH